MPQRKLLNSPAEDYHIHSLNYSDGLHTIDEIVKMAPKFWLNKITITDHSQAVLDRQNLGLKCRRSTLKNRKNYHNEIEVHFGVEGDLLDEEWNCCFQIHGQESDFCILSCHTAIYQGNLNNITTAYCNAIKKYHKKIKLIGHPFLRKTCANLDVPTFIAYCNEYNIPIELDTAYLRNDRTDLAKLKQALDLLTTGLYINSDMHTFSDRDQRHAGFELLKSRNML